MMWFFIKMMIAIYVGIAGIFAFINTFYIKGYIVGFVLMFPFYALAWWFLIDNFYKAYRGDKEIEEQKTKENPDEPQTK